MVGECEQHLRRPPLVVLEPAQSLPAHHFVGCRSCSVCFRPLANQWQVTASLVRPLMVVVVDVLQRISPIYLLDALAHVLLTIGWRIAVWKSGLQLRPLETSAVKTLGLGARD